MKKYVYSLFVALAAAAGFTACTGDDVKYDGPGQWDANAGYANVYFKQSSYTESIDPADPTEYTFNVYRRVQHEYTYGKDAAGNDSVTSDKITTALPAVTVKPTVLENTDGVFTVSDATFAEGDTVATIKATFPNAAIGNPSTLKVTFEGADLVSSYSSNIVYTYTVTRVKWNNIGTGKFRDDFWFEDSWEVEVMQRDDDHSYYRIMDPFGYWAEDLNGQQSQYVELHVLKKGDEITGITMEEAGIVDWYRICTGYVHPNYNDVIYCLHPKNFTSATYRDYSVYRNNRVTDYLENGEAGRIQLAPSWYMFNTGGWNYTTTPTIFINLPGFVEQYEATIDDDFEWETVFKGEYKSSQLGTTSVAELLKGTCVTTTDDCDKVFEETYGTAYRIADPYAEGDTLTFCAKGKKILLAPGYEDPQPLGIKALGQDVYAVINADESSFTDDLITLSITFTDKDGKVAFGTAKETLANITYSQVGTGTYTYAQFWSGDDPDLVISKRDDRDDIYRISHWGYDVDFAFTWDKKTNKCVVDEQFTGYTHATYGDVYVTEATVYAPKDFADDGQSYYDPESSTFHFQVAYVVSAGYFGHGEETFVANFSAGAKKAAPYKAPAFTKYAFRPFAGFKPAAKGFKAQKAAQKYWRFGSRATQSVVAAQVEE